MSRYFESTKKTLNINSKESGEKRFASGIAILTLSTVVVKIIGVIYKIPMIKILGEEGMGYFNSAYEIYTLFYILATAGLPVAVSILIASATEKKQYRNVKRIYKVSIWMFTLLGILFFSIMCFGAEQFSRLIENSNAILCILAISPMALFICISSAVRGYFQGLQNMVPTALSQIIEAAFKLALGLAFAIYSVKRGYSLPKSAAFAALGLTAATAISALYLCVTKLFNKKKVLLLSDNSEEKNGDIARKIINIAVPITISSLVISLTRVIDLVMIMRRMQAIGYSESATTSIYGSYSTLALSMFNLPASFIAPIGLSLVPILTSAIKANDKHKEVTTVNFSLKLCGLIAIPASLGLSLYSYPILNLVFANETKAINIAAPLLSCLSLSVFFSCVLSITNSVLQAYGQERKPILSMIIGSVIKVIASYILIGIPKINIYGAPISTFLCVFTVSAINIFYIRKYNPRMASIEKLFSKTLFAASIAVFTCGICYALITRFYGESNIVTILCVGLTFLLYTLLALKFKAIEENDVLLLPNGEKIHLVLKKIKLI